MTDCLEVKVALLYGACWTPKHNCVLKVFWRCFRGVLDVKLCSLMC